MPGAQGSSCRSSRVFKLYMGVTDKQTHKRLKNWCLIQQKTTSKRVVFKRASKTQVEFLPRHFLVTLVHCYQGSLLIMHKIKLDGPTCTTCSGFKHTATSPHLKEIASGSWRFLWVFCLQPWWIRLHEYLILTSSAQLWNLTIQYPGPPLCLQSSTKRTSLGTAVRQTAHKTGQMKRSVC